MIYPFVLDRARLVEGEWLRLAAQLPKGASQIPMELSLAIWKRRSLTLSIQQADGADDIMVNSA